MQKTEEVRLHGNWTLQNASWRANKFIQRHGTNKVEKYSVAGVATNRTHTCELSVYINQLGYTVTGEGEGPNKRMAKKSSALSLVRKLYHLNQIEEFTGIIQETDKGRKRKANEDWNMNRQNNKLRHSPIGRRTGLDVVQGKQIRTHLYEDYWTKSDSTDENETPESMDSAKTRSKQIRENMSIIDRNSVSFRNISKSSPKKSLNQKKKYKDDYEYSSPEQLKRSKSSRSYFSEDVENAAISTSKMTQTSCLLDNTGNTFSKHGMHEKLYERNETDYTACKIYSSRKNSYRKLSHSLNASHIREGLLSSDDDALAVGISKSSDMKSDKTVNKRSSKVKAQTPELFDATEDSPLKKNSNSFYTERNSSVERCPGVLSETASSSNSKKAVNKRYSSRSPGKSSEIINQKENEFYEGRKSLNKSGNLVSGQRENGLSENDRRKSTCAKSPVEIKRKTAQTPNNENSPFKTSRLQSRKMSRTQIASSDDDDALYAKILKFLEMLSGKKAQDMRSSKVETGTSNLFDVAKDTSFEKETDLFYRERNSSVESSPRVFSKNVSSPSSNEVERYSLRSPTKSSELINQEENELYEGSKKLSKSVNLVSGQKENEFSEKGSQKFSRVKSPVETKRKRAPTPDNRENSLLKTSRLENKENIRNLPGNKSRHTYKYSEAPNPKNEKDLDANIQRSFGEESPIASDSNAVQILDLSENRYVSKGSDLNVKTVSPLHQAKRKIDFSKTKIKTD